MDDTRVFDWDDEIEKESEFTLLNEGDYDFEIVNFERGNYDGSDKIPPCKMAIITFKVTDGKDSNNIMERYYLCGSMEWKLSELFKSVGLKKSGEKIKMPWNKLIGSKGRCKVVVQEYDGRSYNRINKLYAPGAAKKEDDDEWS